MRPKSRRMMEGCCLSGAGSSIFSDQLIPVPGMPTVARVPFLPKVSQPPRPPTDTEVPDLERLRRRPLKREIRRLKRKPMVFRD